MKLIVVLVCCLAALALADDPCDLLTACLYPSGCSILSEVPPPTFSIMWKTTQGPFIMDITTAWAPPYATRLWQLGRLQYFNGASFYRMLRKSANESFVVQFGYNGVPAIDQCWDQNMTSDATWSVHKPGNVRGTVSFSMGSTTPGSNPNCTSSEYCAQGFSTNLFINLRDNSAHLDPPGFSPVGMIRGEGMNVVDSLYSGYGEVADLCTSKTSSDKFCNGVGAQCQGVNMTTLTSYGTFYLLAEKPNVDFVMLATILSE